MLERPRDGDSELGTQSKGTQAHARVAGRHRLKTALRPCATPLRNPIRPKKLPASWEDAAWIAANERAERDRRGAAGVMALQRSAERKGRLRAVQSRAARLH
ncbi:hypothetical protein PSPO01_13643 [Paraphaeosphaeria sporulosa]